MLAVFALIPAAANSYIFTAAAAAADPFSHVIGRNAERVPGGYQGQLTVFKHVSIWASSGPLTLALSSGAEGRVVKVINSLPAWPPIMCHESVLLYVFAFHPWHHLKPLYQFQGWGCTGEVGVTLNGTTLSPLEDRSCSLSEMVGRQRQRHRATPATSPTAVSTNTEVATAGPDRAGPRVVPELSPPATGTLSPSSTTRWCATPPP